MTTDTHKVRYLFVCMKNFERKWESVGGVNVDSESE